MKGVQSLWLLPVLILFYGTSISICGNKLSSTETLTISSNRTLVSPGGAWELGFFKPSATLSRWYLGIWYKNVSEKTYAWVANRDNPLSNSIGTLKISGNNLVLVGVRHDEQSSVWWSTNLTSGNMNYSRVVAELMSNGNFVLRASTQNSNEGTWGFLWQSFDFPTDTLLPGMSLGIDHKSGRNRFLTSWKSYDDPSSGSYTYKLDIRRGLPELFLRKNELVLHRSGPWNGIEFTQEYLNNFVYSEKSEEVRYAFSIPYDQSYYLRLTLDDLGVLALFAWIPAPTSRWEARATLSTKSCDHYNKCPSNSYCDLKMDCNCLQGFDKTEEAYCVRRAPLSCSGNRFSILKNMKLPDTKMAVLDRGIDLNRCEQRCLSDCKCTSFAAADVRNGGNGCLLWRGELNDIRNYPIGGQDLYVKVAAVDPVLSSDEERDSNGKIIGWSLGVSLVLILSAIVFCFWKGRKKQEKAAGATPTMRNKMVLPRKRNLSEKNYEVEDLELPLMELEAVLIATDNFSDRNKVGEGGFGAVYKGRLLDGQEIAVKRLSEMSAQGTSEFMNEINSIAKLLVRLLGCCVEEREKMLIYEYLENLSLDSFLFGHRSCMLNWQMRFQIISGIARGILYLHQDSSIRIIHRDLKASNVLLDKDMTPKISDFGMARIFGRDETEAKTRKVVGTYGYMSPEYAFEGRFSVKSDAFSFGVVVLEIITRADDRPLMSAVVLMLGSETADIPEPKLPGFCVTGNSRETKEEKYESCTVNQITMSITDAR
ncbi:unnamed protein product [Eruca vesicaria subsp. sativa]|uniref:Receptor-like serine/threonine-protein kinase n=1 Tax=Eruca vesicaria subsp. sativa TaxID=29727 RepID=A0ABC8M2T8_ERUVS|nr:unnamed protein product [Eruca vesicaria subsp. sativa]